MPPKRTTIDAFFKKQDPPLETATTSVIDLDTTTREFYHPQKYLKFEDNKVDINQLERDPGLRPQIWEYHVNQLDEVRRAYINFGPSQPILHEYPLSGSEKHRRRFQSSWYKIFPSWLEYSPTKDAVFCLPCYLFSTKTSTRFGSTAFTIEGFSNWKKVNNGKNCALLAHIGRDPNSPHNYCEQSCRDLMIRSQHIDLAFQKHDNQQIANNRLRLKATIDSIKWLAFQACPFRGHDEHIDSKNRGNFIELVKILASYNDDVAAVVLDNAPGNAKYTSPKIQKEILNILSNRVRNAIREEIGDEKFCLIVDEARDESKKEQMAIILRFVDNSGFIRERFFDIIHVHDTSAYTLKKEISCLLARYNLNVKNIRGQGYDGASNMRGEWNGLQALFLKECPYAYYVHCLAHRLQLALVTSCKEVIPIYHFFSKLSSIVNIVTESSKRNDELHAARASQLEQLLASNEIQTGKGLNQVQTLQRAGDTRWGSYLSSITSLINMFSPTCEVLKSIINDGSTYAQRGDADAAFDAMTSFEFVLILHIMKEILSITHDLCQALQRQSQDIVNAMNLVHLTKELIQKLREQGWSSLMVQVISFCEKYNVIVPDMNSIYIAGRGRARHKENHVTMEHHYRVDIFIAAVDSQLYELNNRFDSNVMELLILTSALDPKDNYKAFDIEKIYALIERFYPGDFSEQEKLHMRYEAERFHLDITQRIQLQSASSISDLCHLLAESGLSRMYPLIDRLIRLILTLPVSTATTERAFSAMKIVKTRLRTKMDDEFLADCMIIYIEKEIAQTFSTDLLISDFDAMKERRAPLM